MKKNIFILDFLIFIFVLLYCIIPPFFANSENLNFLYSWNFPVEQAVRFLFAVMLYILCSKFKTKNISFNIKNILYYIVFPSTFYLCILFAVSLVIKSISIFFPIYINGINYENVKINLPKNAKEFIFCLLTFFFSGFFEEVLYRFYFCEAIKKLLNCKKIVFDVLIEIAGVLVFALAHYYSGFYSVINAVFAQLILRFCYKKTGNIYSGFIAHFIYNIISLYLL